MSVAFEKVLVLKNMPLFAHCAEGALADLVSLCEEQTYKAGEVILSEKHPNQSLYFILSGTVHLMRGKVSCGELAARQMFGYMTAWRHTASSYRVVAYEDTILLSITAQHFYQAMALHATLAFALLGELTQRLELMQNKLEESKKND